MKKILLLIIMTLLSCPTVLAQVVSDNVQKFISNDFPNTDFRFDGAIILPDNTMYLPVFPAKTDDTASIEIKTTYPINMKLKQKPDMVILNNNLVLLKVLNSGGKKTVMNMITPPTELQSGLLSQELLLPKGMVIPENLKGIVGNLDVDLAKENGLRINNANKKNINSNAIAQLKDKVFYVATGANKNLQVVDANSKVAEYALKQENVINDIKCYKNEFLLVSYFNSKVLNIISMMDEKVIKQVHLDNTPEQILIDEENKVAYITSGMTSSIYVLSLETMTLKKQLKVNGLCEKFTLSQDGTKLFYVDRNTNNIWAIELDNNYLLKNIGKFPNISKIEYTNNTVYVISRTKNRIAVVEYDTLEPLDEIEISEKPVDMYIDGKELYILCAQDNILEVMDTEEDVITDKIYLYTNSFSTNIVPIKNTDLIMVTNALSGVYAVVDKNSKSILKITPLDIPVRSIVVANKVKTIK